MIKVYLFSAPPSAMDAGAVVFFDLLAQMCRVLAHGGMYLCVINYVNKGNTIGFAVTAGSIFHNAISTYFWSISSTFR